MKSFWKLDNYLLYRKPDKVKKWIGKSCEVLWEEKLENIPRLLSIRDRIESFVLVKGEWILAVGLKLASGRIIPMNALIRYEYKSAMEACFRNCFPIEEQDLNNLCKVEEMLDYWGTLTTIQMIDEQAARLLPKRLPPVPREIVKKAAPGDVYGIFSKSAYWWWRKKTGDVHIIGHGSADTFDYEDPDNSFARCSLLTLLFEFFVDIYALRKLVIHEGITSFTGISLKWDPEAVFFTEICLPYSLKTIKRLNCFTEKLKIPETIKKVDFDALFIRCGGHWDPVEYAAETLIVPSAISFIGELPYLEPIQYWRTLEIYGKTPIPDLNKWYRANIIGGEVNEMLDIAYPSSWDRGIPGSYSEYVAAFLRKKKPFIPDWSAGNNMYHPCAYKEWTDNDYDAFKCSFHPKAGRIREAAVSQDRTAADGQNEAELTRGSYIKFGQYRQSRRSRTKEAIEWQILDIFEDQMLIISRYGLDVQPYHQEFEEVSWADCSLRTWLNSTFLDEAFSSQQQSAILVSLVGNGEKQNRTGGHLCASKVFPEWVGEMDHWDEYGHEENGYRKYFYDNKGCDTEDQVFLLSIQEVKEYFGEDGLREKCVPTGYSISKGARRSTFCRGTYWWLRSQEYMHASVVSGGGCIERRLVNDRDCAVKPAMWVSMDFFK